MSHHPRGPRVPPLELSERQRALLVQFTRQASCPQAVVLRARIILQAATEARLQHIAETFGVHPDTVRTWRQRWVAAGSRLAGVEAKADDATLRQVIREVLTDAPRSGTPATFSAEQICQIIAVSCEPVEATGRPVSHWTPRELADEVITRGIVSRISPRQVGRFLKGGRLTAASGRVLAESRARPRPGAIRSGSQDRL